MEADVTVRELMAREYVGVSESDSVADASELLLQEDAGAAVVVRGNEPVGILSKTDALAHVAGDGAADDPVSAAMSGTPPRVDPTASFVDAANRLAEAGTECLLVSDGSDLVGVVTERDVVGAAASLSTKPAHEGGQDHAVPTRSGGAGNVGESADAETEYSRQSVCEICGSLTPDLQNFNGQLICADCREV